MARGYFQTTPAMHKEKPVLYLLGTYLAKSMFEKSEQSINKKVCKAWRVHTQ